MELFKRVIIWEFSFYLFNYFYQFDNRAVIETKITFEVYCDMNFIILIVAGYKCLIEE